MKQTAVEWLALYIKGITSLNCDEVIEQAKEMEKEQIIEAYDHGEWNQGCNGDAKQYYIETYEQHNYPEIPNSSKKQEQ